MKKNGFTLAELLGVVIVLGILLLLVVTPIVNNINNQGDKIDSLTTNLLYSSAEVYMDSQGGNYKPIEGAIYYISIKQLIDSKLLEKKMISAEMWTSINEEAQIKVTITGGNYSYELINDETRYRNNINYVANNINSVKVYQNNNTYFSSNLTNNYVYYSGMKWRIIGINSDGSVRLLLDEDITTIIPSNGSSEYKNSYVRSWLNEELYSKLSGSDLIVKGTFCADVASNSSQIKANCDTNIKDYIGLLSLYEINAGLNKDMINNASNFVLTTMKGSDKNKIYVFTHLKGFQEETATNAQFIRPVINIAKNTFIISGTGDINNPYILGRQIKYTTNQFTNKTELPIGTYLIFGNTGLVYRVIESTDEYIKITANFSANSIVFSQNNSKFNIEEGVGYHLNYQYIDFLYPSDIFKSKLIKNRYYISDYASNASNYKVYSKDKFLVEDARVGLPKLGEVLTAPICTTSGCPTNYITATESNENFVYQINLPAPNVIRKTFQESVKPVVYLENNLKIISGSGTQTDPLKLATS